MVLGQCYALIESANAPKASAVEYSVDTGIFFPQFLRAWFSVQTVNLSLTMTFRTSLALESLTALVLAFTLALSVQAQTVPGKAEVRAVKGNALFSAGGSPAMPLKVGAILGPGTTIKTGSGSSVDLFLGRTAGTLRIAENTAVSVDKLALTDTGADTAAEVQIGLTDGTILGDVNKLSAASRYEIKTPNGVAGIRGTRYRISANSFIVLLDGTMVYVYVPPGGNPTPYTLAGPPAVYFSPTDGVKPAPEDLIRETRQQVPHGPPFTPPGPPPEVPFKDPFISPGTGKPVK